MIAVEIDRGGAGDAPAPAEVIVEKQPGSQQQARASARHLRQHEALRPDDVAGIREQHLALLQCLAHEAELEMLKVAQPAMDELGASRGGGAGEIAHLGKEDGEAAAGGVCRDADAVDAAADNDEIVGHGFRLSMPGS